MDLPTDVAQELRRAYGRPSRAYHSWEHARRVVGHVEELGGSRAARIAAWFHDAVYVPGAEDNEAASAALLERLLPGDPDAGEAARLVHATATHDPVAGDRDAEILCDADLAVLGGDAEAYEAYRSAVREEHAHVPEEGWRLGRGTVLRALLDRPTIFRTAAARARWEGPARANLRRELAALGTAVRSGGR